VLFCRIWSF